MRVGPTGAAASIDAIADGGRKAEADGCSSPCDAGARSGEQVPIVDADRSTSGRS